MKTISIGIHNPCVPCSCACKYCLLQSCKEAEGIDYYRGKKLAERFIVWAKNKSITPLPFYCISYCAEYPQLLDNISFNKENGFLGANFLQCNGLKIRTLSETDQFIKNIKSAGIENIDTTFFGNPKYHDSFAAREGDYDFMLLLAKRAAALDLNCSPTVVVSRESLSMLDELFDILESIPGIGRIYSFLPDYRGRGYLMEKARITVQDYEKLSDKIKKTFNISRYKTQKDWLSSGVLPEYTQRALTVTLRKDNIDRFENMSCDEIIAYVEKLDDDYYKAIPSINELAEIYGNKENEQLYRLRDLFWMWQKRYIHENHISIYDITDERYCNTIRS